MTRKRINLAVGITTLIFLMISLTSASIFCDKSMLILNSGQTSDSVVCSNSDANNYPISTSGPFTLNVNSLTANSSQTITATISNPVPNGYSAGLININSMYFVAINITGQPIVQQVENTGVITFPTSKVINVQQGQTKTQNIQVIVPGNYPTSITLQSVSFDPDVDLIKFGDLNLGIITPGTTVNIPIVIDATNAQTGTYATQVIILATNTTGQVKLNPTQLTVNVQAGINPITNSTFTVRPTCSLNSVIMNLNQTYSFVCSNTVNNLDINPIYNDYFEGLSADLSGSIYTYNFRPVKFGNTIFEAFFLYKNSPIFSKFSQEVRISSSGSGIPGTDLDLVFTPTLSNAKAGDLLTIQVIDNKTNSLRTDATLYIDAKPVNKSDGSFYFLIDADRNYSVRAMSNGYNDLVRTIYLTSQDMQIFISPSSGDTTNTFTINTSVANASLYLDGNLVSNPYISTIAQGLHNILAIKEGYFNNEINITIETSPIATLSTEFKKGKIQVVNFNKNLSYELFYQQELNSVATLKQSGNAADMTFTPDKNGIYIVKTNNLEISRWEIKGNNGSFFGIKWYVYLVGVIIIFLLFYLSKSSSSSSGSIPMGMGGNLNIR